MRGQRSPGGAVVAEDAGPPVSLEEAYAACRRITLGHSENFSVVSWLLPRHLRPHMYAVYAYCRGVDDLGDEAVGDRLALLGEWEAELNRCFEGTARDSRFVALADAVRRFDMPREPFGRLIEANRRDQRVTRYESFADLIEYCTYSAHPVGHMVLYLFGYRDAERQRLADATCTALQLTNFWQDVSRDIEKGRIYLPQEDMRHFGVTEDDLVARRVTPGFRDLLRFEVARTRGYFRDGLPLIKAVRGRLRLDLNLFTLGGMAVLDEIERADYDVLTRRPRVTRARKAWLALRGLLPVAVRPQ